MPILLWVVYPFAIWSACFEVLPARVPIGDFHDGNHEPD
jgi:hypothetical protein